MMKPILLMGGGGHCKSVIESIENTGIYKIIGITDVSSKKGSSVLGYPIIGTEDDLQLLFDKNITNCFITLGSIGNSSIRERLYTKALEIGFNFPVVTDKTAIISQNTTVKAGTFIGKGVIINAASTIGENSIINSGAIVEHDSIIGPFTHVAPGTTLCGGVIVGRHTHIGANSVVIQSVNIGNNSIIGAGSVVLEDIDNHKLAYGNPCKVID